ncbi:Mechanosensitive ion channel protein 5 [Dictyocoela roeselum]|nr:Mechanosensitive ion channel protein 5 [Dictyocoela roeselum]
MIVKNEEMKFSLQNSFMQMNLALERAKFFITIVGCIVLASIIFSCMTRLDNPFLAFFGTIFGTSFFLNSSIENVISCTLFLFYIHPYDVGDRIILELDEIEENLIVSELNVFSTVFAKINGGVLVVPNRTIQDKLIVNLRRCGIMTECHKIQVCIDTAPRKFERLRNTISSYLNRNQDMYTDFLMLNFESIEDSNILHVNVVMQYKKNWQDDIAYWKAKSMFLKELKSALQTCGIKYKLITRKIIDSHKRN